MIHIKLNWRLGFHELAGLRFLQAQTELSETTDAHR